MSHSSPQGMKYNRSSLLSLENNYRHANGGAKLLMIRKLKSIYMNSDHFRVYLSVGLYIWMIDNYVLIQLKWSSIIKNSK